MKTFLHRWIPALVTVAAFVSLVAPGYHAQITQPPLIPTNLVCGRLSLTTATPVTNSDVTAATTLFYTPIQGCNQVVVWSGVSLMIDTLTEQSLAIPATTSTMYDVFAVNNANAINIEALAWTNDTTRATAITVQNGFLAKSGDATRRYIGSFRTTTVSGQAEDSGANRFVWNYYNRAYRTLAKTDSTATWAYTLAAYHQANANTANQVNVIVGVAETTMTLSVSGIAQNNNADVQFSVAIGEDSTTVPLLTLGIGDTVTANRNQYATCTITKMPAIGKHSYNWLENSQAVGAMTWSGGSAIFSGALVGLNGGIWG